MTDVIMVPFEGAGAGTGELTWGQQHIWGTIQALGSTMNMCAIRELSPGASVDEFVEELRYYVSRFQAMRTRLRFVPGGLPLQVVVSSGEVPLEIVDVAAGEDPAEVATALVARHEDTPFDYAVDFPIRMTLVRRDGVLTHMITVLSHLATDGAGGFAMYNDYMHRDAETGRAAEPVGMQPLDLAAQQHTPAGIRQSGASLRYWEEMLRTIPLRGPETSADTGESRYWQLEMDSPAMFLAVRTIANRVGIDVSTVLLGVYAVALARVTGSNPSVVQMLVSNRFRPGLAEIVSNISQTGLFVVDVAGVTVDEAIARTRRASIRAYKHAYFDLPLWQDLIERVARERGGEIDLGCYYNDRPSQYQAPDLGSAWTRDEIEAALPRTSPLRWTQLPFFNERVMVTINDAPDAIALLVLADTHFVPKTEMERLAREMESLAVAAASDPDTATGVTVGASAVSVAVSAD
jgi:hypothetical protein